MPNADSILQQLLLRFGEVTCQQQNTIDEILTLWVPANKIVPVIQYLKSVEQPFNFLYDLCGADERDRAKKESLPAKDFTVIYHLFSFDRNSFIRLKVALEDKAGIPSITALFKNANWYEREVYDMFGIQFDG